jgi:LAO/AO transport system kinase
VSLTADTTLVVVVPGLGDDVQALKAGILEAADVFAVNKADREGAEAAVSDLESMVSLGESILVDAAHRAPSGGGHGARFRAPLAEPLAGAWRPPIVRTVASTDQGIDDLITALDAHRAHLATHDASMREERERARLVTRLRDELTTAALHELDSRLSAAASRLAAGQSDPYSECEALVREFRQGLRP